MGSVKNSVKVEPLPKNGQEELRDRALMDAKVRLEREELSVEQYERRVGLILQNEFSFKCQMCNKELISQLTDMMGPENIIRLGGSPLLFRKRREFRRTRKRAVEWHAKGPKPSTWLLSCSCGHKQVARFLSSNPYR